MLSLDNQEFPDVTNVVKVEKWRSTRLINVRDKKSSEST